MAMFDDATYYANKAAQLSSTGYGGRTDWLPEEVQSGFQEQGLTPESHYEQYGKEEFVNPYASREPTVMTPGISATRTSGTVPVSQFSEDVYYQNKVAQLNRDAVGGRTDWGVGEVQDAFAERGLTPQQHFEQYGESEGVSPYGYRAEEPKSFLQGPGQYGDVATERDIRSGLDYVDQAKSTVAGQLQTLLSSDNPYITQARQGAIETAAGRGLLNTSIAAGKGQAAAYEAAMPIVQQDAGTFAAAQARQQEGEITSTIQSEGYNAQGRLQSQTALQRMDQTRLEGDINMALQGAGYQNQRALQNAAQGGDRQAIELQGTIQTARDTFAAKEATKMANLQAANQTALTRIGLDAAAANLYSQTLGTLTNTTLSTVNNLLNNMDIGDVPAAMESLKLFLGSTELGKNIYLPDLDLTGSLIE